MAALSQAPNPDPVRFEAASLTAFNDLIARNWPHIVPLVDEMAKLELNKAIGNALGGIRIVGLSGVTLDIAEPPALDATMPAPQQTIDIHVPRSPGTWSLKLDATIGGTIPIRVGGLTTTVTIQLAVEATAADVRVVQPFDMDLSDPLVPVITGAGAPSVSFQLLLDSPDPLLSQILPQVTSLLRPVVQVGLVAASHYARQQVVGFLQTGLPPGRLWGRGGPALVASTATADLAVASEDMLSELQANHMPFGNMYPAFFDTPHTGGSVHSYRHWGDSALWTGVTLGTMSYRQDLTGRTDASAKMREMVKYYDIQTRMTAPLTGLLSRTAIPASSPHAQPLLAESVSWVAAVDGVQYVGLGNTSRDSYTGTMFGLGQAYHRVPALRTEIATIVNRMMGYLESYGWVVYQAPGQKNVGPNGPGISVPFAQSPLQVHNFTTIAHMIDPTAWGPLRQRVRELTELCWFNAWVSAHEVHWGYYGFSLGHINTLSAVELETEPYHYRGLLKNLAVMRETVGHHQNAAFDAVAGIAVPTRAAQMGTMVKDELGLLVERPRRGFRVTNSQDPSILWTTYVTSIPNQTGSPGQPVQTGARSTDAAIYPVPIPKRPSTSYVWSSSPFELDGNVDPREQQPGLDLLFPFWISQSHGLFAP
jgi:hypothetical protein